MEPEFIKTIRVGGVCLPMGDYDLYRSQYMSTGGVTALFLTEPDDKYDQAAVLTVNLPGLAPRDGHVFIKTWSENEGILESLQAAGVVGDVVSTVPTGFASAAEVKLLAGAVGLWADRNGWTDTSAGGGDDE